MARSRGASTTWILPIWLIVAIGLCLPRASLANYALGGSAPMCWALAGNTPISCPEELEIDWVSGLKPHSVIAVGHEFDTSFTVNITKRTLDDLQLRGLLSKNPNITSDEKWHRCATQSGCLNTDADSCCYFHVNVHSCLDKPGTFCGPWVKNDGFLATHTPAATGNAGSYGKTRFNFKQQLFWEGPYTIIAHVKFAAMHFAVGVKSVIKFSSAICEPPLVPGREGTCEACPAGTQPLGVSVAGTKPINDEEAYALNLNPFCIPCPPGSFSSNGTTCRNADPGFFQNASGQAIQIPCPAGTSNSREGMTECTPCYPGMYSGPQQTICRFCEVGRIQEKPAQPDCIPCGHNFVTMSLGSTTPTLCGCPAGKFLPAPGHLGTNSLQVIGGTTAHYTIANESSSGCLECPWGMSCAGFFATDDTGDPILAWHAQPVTQVRFFAATDDPYKAFMCKDKKWCPGNMIPGSTCAENREGFVCGKCKTEYWAQKDGTCTKCESGDRSFSLSTGIILMILMPWVVYAGYDVKLSHNKQSPKHVALSSGHILVYFLEGCAIFNEMNIRWPFPVKEVLGTASIFSFKLDQAKPACMFGSWWKFELSYPLSVLLPAIFGGSLVIGLLLSKCFACICKMPKLAFSFVRVVSAFGIVYVALYVAVCRSTLRMFECFRVNPDGRTQLAAFSYIECSSDRWWSMVPLGAAMGLLYGVASFAFALWVCKVAVKYFSAKKSMFRQCFGFMFHEFRRDSWWWLPVIMMRNLMMPMTLVIVPGDGQAQVALMFSITLAYLVPLLSYWPWLTYEVNVLDAATMGVGMALFISFSSSFKDEAVGETNDAVYATLLSIALIGSLLLLVSLWATNMTKHIHNKCSKLGFGSSLVLSLSARVVERAANENACVVSMLLETAENLSELPIEKLQEIISHMNYHDIQVVHRFLSVASVDFLKRGTNQKGLRVSRLMTSEDEEFYTKNDHKPDVHNAEEAAKEEQLRDVAEVHDDIEAEVPREAPRVVESPDAKAAPSPRQKERWIPDKYNAEV